ncbi:MAG: SpoIIE family protein phosphatase [Spirochaetota bacterium]
MTVRFIVIALVLFLGFAVVSSVGLFVQVRAMADDLGKGYAEQRVETAKAQIGGRLQREASLAKKLAGSPTVKRWMQDEENEERRELAFAELASYREAFVDSNYFVAIDQSKHYYNQPEDEEMVVTTLSEDDEHDEWYFATLEAGREVSFNLDYNAALDVSRVWINCLVFDEGEVIGAAGTGLEITDFVSRFLAESQTARGTMITDLDGTIIAHPRAEIMEENALTSSEEDKTSVFDLVSNEPDRERFRSLAESAADGKTEVAPIDVEGRSLVTAVARLPELDALLIESVDTAAFISPRDFLPLFVLVGLVMLVALTVLALLVEHRVLFPLSELTESARRVAAGEYELSLPSAGRTDEIGTLSATFEDMAAQVASYTARLEQRVEQRTRELTEANQELDHTNRTLTESIRYAELIQQGVMATEQACARRLGHYQLFLRQRDIVGGDFLFLRDTTEGGFLLAVLDCEGHGVSGALMTMMADSFLRQIVSDHDPRDPAVILGDLETAVRGSLDTDFGEAAFTSGFDIGLCACFPDRGELIYAGAGMPLYMRDEGANLTTIAGRRKAVRSRHRKEPAAFENHVYSTKGRVFYLLTDGFVDQAGGTKGRAYGTTRLYSMLSEVDHSRLRAEENFWEHEFDSHRGQYAQRDDVLAVAFTLEKESATIGDEDAGVGGEENS